MVNVNVPAGDLRLVFAVSVDEPLPLIDTGAKLPLLRPGKPLTLGDTEPAIRCRLSP